MNISSTPFGVADAAPAMARRFGLILAGLGALVARRFLRVPHLMGFTLLLHSRLNRAVRRFERALTRPALVRAPQLQLRGRRGDIVRVRSLALPAGRGWLVRELGWEAAAYKSYLELLLAEPEMQVAMARLPAVGRILRPVCRMLGVTIPIATPPLIVAAMAPEVIMATAPAEMLAGRDPLPGTWQDSEPPGRPGVATDYPPLPSGG